MFEGNTIRIQRIFPWLLVHLIKFYQLAISPLLLPSCRFVPSCSQYAIDAIERHGPVKGIVYAVLRILKCHPFHPGGCDPVR